jgi:hypothetical protein
MAQRLKPTKCTVVILTIRDDGPDDAQPYVFPGHLTDAEAMAALRQEFRAEQGTDDDAEAFPDDYDETYAVSIATMTVDL